MVQKPAALAGTDFSHKHGVKNDENGPKQFVLPKEKILFQLIRNIQKVLNLRKMTIQGGGTFSAIDRLCASSAPLSISTGGDACVPEVYARKPSIEVW